MDQPRTAKDIMVTRLVTVSPESNVFDGIRLLLTSSITGAPVVDPDGTFLGVLSETCCLSVLRLAAELATEAGEVEATAEVARDVMTTKLLTFATDTDAFEAIEQLLRHRVSGAPVVDRQDGFLGVFSERYAMSLLIQSAYEGVPSPRVGAFMNTDAGRIVGEETPVMEIARIFLNKYYRRLPVVRDGRLVGQISRRDLLGRNHNLTPLLRRYEDRLLEHSGEIVPRGGTAAGGGRLESSAVAAFMDREARTVSEDIDLLAIAQIFQQTNARRLPVVRQGRLVGQISRRDVLVAAHALMSVAPKPERALLYLSAVLDRTDVPPIP